MPYDVGNIALQPSQSGISAFGQGFNPLLMEAIKRYQQTQKEQAFSDQVVQGLAKNPATQKYLMGDKDSTVADALDRYTKMGHNQKQGYSQGIMATMAADLQQQKAAQDASSLKNDATYKSAMVNKLNAEANKDWMNPSGNSSPTYDQNTQTVPVVIDGKTIPGIGQNLKNGQYLYYGKLTAPGGAQITFDPTGVPGYSNSKGDWKPIKIEDVQAAEAYKKSKEPPSPSSNPLVNWWRGTNIQSQRSTATQPLAVQPQAQLPQPGEVRGNWKFKGGDPSDQGSWEPVQPGQ